MPLTDSSEALAELAILIQPLVCPTLTTAEQTAILEMYKRGTLWAATTLTNLGSIVIPTLPNRNGCRYKAVEYTTTATNQKTGATEPSWSTTRYSQVTDGVVIWQEDGFDWDAVLWDLTGAARAGWLLKASKASLTSDYVRGEFEHKSSQLYDHCLSMADRFQPAFIL